MYVIPSEMSYLTVLILPDISSWKISNIVCSIIHKMEEMDFSNRRSQTPLATKDQMNPYVDEMLHVIETFTDLEIFTETHITQNSDQILKNIAKHIHILESVNSLDEEGKSIRFWDAFSKHCKIINVLIRVIAEMKSRLEQAYEDYVQRHSEHSDQEEDKKEYEKTVDSEISVLDVVFAKNDNVTEEGSSYILNTIKVDNGKKESLEDRYICVECGVQFKNRGSLKPHYNRVHRNVKPKSCNVCGRKFASSGDLTRHNRTHNGERPFLCPQCPQTFISSGDMNKHVRRHNRDLVPIPRNFVCNICGAAFDLSNSLKRHKKKHEAVDSREFVCEFCSKNFYRKDQFKEHIIRHLGVRSFPCSMCSKKFCDRKNRLKHELTHQIGPFTCDYCAKVLATKSEIFEHFKKFHKK